MAANIVSIIAFGIASLTWEWDHTLRRPGRSSSDVEMGKALCGESLLCESESILSSESYLHRPCDEGPLVRKLLWQARLVCIFRVPKLLR